MNDGTFTLIWFPCVMAYFYPLAYRIFTGAARVKSESAAEINKKEAFDSFAG